MRQIIKKTLKIIGIALLSFLLFVVLFLSTAFICSRITISKDAGTKDEVAIYIKTNGVHTDIVMPVRSPQIDWSREIKYAYTALNDTTWRYIALGWGDKGFYLQTPDWSDLKFSVAFNATFGLSTTAMHATFYKGLPENDRCHKMLISKEQYARLIDYVTNSFQHDANGHFINIKTKANYSQSDAFYEANGSYSLFHTCNTWANNALKKCGQKCCLWTIFDTGIFLKYAKN